MSATLTKQSRQENGGGSDPNLGGSAPTSDPHPWEAGTLSAWQENDDYRDFTFKTENVAESRLECHPMHDGDYDDNGGYASETVVRR